MHGQEYVSLHLFSQKFPLSPILSRRLVSIGITFGLRKHPITQAVVVLPPTVVEAPAKTLLPVCTDKAQKLSTKEVLVWKMH